MNKIKQRLIAVMTSAAMLISLLPCSFGAGTTAFAAGTLPASYTPSTLLGIENQGNTNLCWAFSGTSAIEYNILKNSSAYTSEQLSAMQQDGEIDLYEKALAYYTLNPKTADTTDLTYGSGGTNLGNTTALYETGGGPLMLVWQLARWSGPVSYANEPDTYELASITSSDVANEFGRYDSLAHLQNAKVIFKDDTNAQANIKQAILDYGAVATGILTNTSYYNTSPTVANDGRYAFYLPSTGSSTGAHAVAIVGWDDSYSKENFLESSRPSADGAWLCRNSTPLDGSGYFWMSYEQTFAENPIAFDMEPNDNYDNNYQYSGSEGSQHSLNVGNTGITYAINVFTAEDDEVLEAVSFFTDVSTLSGGTTVPANYTVKIIKDFTAFDEIGNTAFAAAELPEADVEISGTTENFYTTVEFAPITLKAGEKYAVCVNTNHNGRERYYVDGGNQSTGRSYVYFNGYAIDTYTDGSENITTKSFGTVSYVGGYTAMVGGNFQIRAFTSDMDKYTVTANNDGTHTLTRNKYGRTSTEEHILALTEVDETNHSESCSVCNYAANVPHDFSYSNIDHQQHSAICECGYETTEDHDLEYSDDGRGMHDITCSKCEFESGASHIVSCVYKDADMHTKSCSQCDYTEDVAHTFEYTSNGDGTHTSSCEDNCTGYVPVTEPCTYVNGSCTYCEAVASGVAYIDPTAAEPNKLCEEYTELTSDMTTLNAGWYYVDGTITINGAVTVSGDVNLILADGCTLTVSGVTVNTGNSLTIYGQKNATGTLTSTATDVISGIGSDQYNNGGDITINGGTIVATGAGGGAGIGAASGKQSGTITINGGNITATGSKGTYSGAGIGGGARAGNGEIIINGGNVKAYGISSSWGSKAIGSGSYTANACGNITINNCCSIIASTEGESAFGSTNDSYPCTVTIANTLTQSGVDTTSATITGSHKGGTATCVSKANCVACGEEYGPTDSTNHTNKSEEYSYDENYHWYECDCGEADKAEHISGGAATETTPEVCTECGYEIAPATGAFIISQSDVTLADDTFTYNGSEQKPTVIVTKGNTTLTENTDYTLTFTADSTNAGEKMVTVTGAGNYSGSTVELTYTIRRAVLDSISIDVAAPVAGDAAQDSITEASGYTATIAWSPDATTFGYNTAYTATVTLTADDNHKFDSTIFVIDWSVSFNDDNTIATLTRTFDKTEKADPTYTAPVGNSLTYSGSAQELVTAGTVSDGCTMEYSTDNVNWSADIPTKINSDTYTVYWRVDGGDNYNDYAGNYVTVSIGKAALTITAKSYTVKLGDTLPTTLEYTATGLVGDDTTDSISANITVGYENGVTPSALGEYAIVVSGKAKTDNYTITYENGKLIITEKDIQEIEADDVVLTYGDTNGKITATAIGSISYEVATGKDIISVDENGNITILKFGTATVTITAEDTFDYAEATKTISVTVNKKRIALPSADGTEYTYTGTAQTYGVTSTDDYTVEGGTQTNAGEYPVTITLNNENYEWDGTLGTYTFIIKQAPVTVTAKSYTIKVGEALPTYAYDVAGLVNGETLPIDVTISCNAADSNTAGTYDIIVSGAAASDNYTFSYVKGTLTVSEKEVVAAPTFTPASGTTFTSSQKVTISCATAGATIYYTTDGTEPTTASTLYNGAFTITTTTTIKAIAVKDGMTDSAVVTATYTKKSSGGGGGGGYTPSRPTTPNNPEIGGKSASWVTIASDISKLPIGSEITIELNGNYDVPVDVIKQIAENDIKVTFIVDSTRSWYVDGAKIETPTAADLSILAIASLKADGLRGDVGAKLRVDGTNIPTELVVALDKKYAGKFANLYKKDGDKLVFVDNIKVDENGKVILPVSEQGDYVIMLCEFSDLKGDVSNDGVTNALDASAILKDIVELEDAANPEMLDYNGDGKVNALDASAILIDIVNDRI